MMDSVFGVSLDIIKSNRRKLGTVYALGILLDVLCIVFTVLIFGTSTGIIGYTCSCVVPAVLYSLSVDGLVAGRYREAYKFYKRVERGTVTLVSYALTADCLYEILKESGYLGVKSGGSVDTYLSCIRGACLLDRRNALRIGMLMKPYLGVHENSVGVVVWCYMLGRGKKVHFIDYKEGSCYDD